MQDWPPRPRDVIPLPKYWPPRAHPPESEWTPGGTSFSRSQEALPGPSRSLGDGPITYSYFPACEGKGGRTDGRGRGAQVGHFSPLRVWPCSYCPCHHLGPSPIALAWMTQQPPQWSLCPLGPFPTQQPGSKSLHLHVLSHSGSEPKSLPDPAL